MEYEEKLNLAKKTLESGSYDKSTIEYIFSELKEENIIACIGMCLMEANEQRFKNCNLTRRVCLDWLKKQGEQVLSQREGKSALEAIKEEKTDNVNKIKPKFKAGDWIANNKGHLFLIGAIEGNKYLFEDGGYTHEQLKWEYIENADKRYNLWSFDKNAEDGDVLVHCNRG